MSDITVVALVVFQALAVVGYLLWVTWLVTQGAAITDSILDTRLYAGAADNASTFTKQVVGPVSGSRASKATVSPVALPTLFLLLHPLRAIVIW